MSGEPTNRINTSALDESDTPEPASSGLSVESRTTSENSSQSGLYRFSQIFEEIREELDQLANTISTAPASTEEPTSPAAPTEPAPESASASGNVSQSTPYRFTQFFDDINERLDQLENTISTAPVSTEEPTSPAAPTELAPESASASGNASQSNPYRFTQIFDDINEGLFNAIETAPTTTEQSASALESIELAPPTTNLYSDPPFVERTRQGERWTETLPTTSRSESFGNTFSFFSSYISGLRFPEDANRNDYSLGFFLYFLKISILVVSNITLNASVWTGIIEGIETKKFPGNTRIPQNFLVANMANEHLSFPSTVLYDNPTGSRHGLPPASAALLGIFVTACVCRLLVVLVYKFQKIKAKPASAGYINITPGADSESTPLLPTVVQQPPFVVLLDRYNSVNAWRGFLLPLLANTVGTLFTFAIINGIALSKVNYPTIPDAQRAPANSLLENPKSYMLLLTLVSLATSFLLSLIFVMIKPPAFRREVEGVWSAHQIVTVGTNPIYESPDAINDSASPAPPEDNNILGNRVS